LRPRPASLMFHARPAGPAILSAGGSDEIPDVHHPPSPACLAIMITPSIRILPLILMLTPALAAAQVPARYTVERLGDVNAMRLSDSGTVVGMQGSMEESRPFVQGAGGRRYLEGLTGGSAYRVSEAGGGVGPGREGRSFFAFTWRDGVTTRLPVPEGVASSQAYGVNGRGDVVGRGSLGGGNAVALAWSGGTVRSLPPLVPGKSAAAEAINDAGWIVGHARAADDEPHAVLWRDGRVEDLGTMGAASIVPHDLNERGQVVGSAQMRMGRLRAFLWENGTMTDLTPQGATATAKGINDSGQVVGNVATGSELARPVLWAGGRMVYLDEMLPADAGLRLIDTRDINNRGWILGIAQLPDGKVEAVLLKPER
jgi:probable HAF family extracellular repeat protein